MWLTTTSMVHKNIMSKEGSRVCMVCTESYEVETMLVQLGGGWQQIQHMDYCTVKLCKVHATKLIELLK